MRLPADNMYELFLRVREEDQAERLKEQVKKFLSQFLEHMRNEDKVEGSL